MVWAHNSHLGDARATDMGWRRGELNLGQLARQAYADGEVWNIGFTTNTGGCTWLVVLLGQWLLLAGQPGGRLVPAGRQRQQMSSHLSLHLLGLGVGLVQ